MDLYSGPDYLIHFRYAALLNIIFVTMFYGTGLPILYPIAFVSILILYLSELILIHYWFQRPPMYDEKMSSTALGILPIAGVIGCMISYWMVSNNQIFTNMVYLQKTKNSL